MRTLHLATLFLVAICAVPRGYGYSFPLNGKCSSALKKSPFSVSPYIAKPAPSTYCFTILAKSNYSSCTSSCCQGSDVAKLLLNANPGCDAAPITATLNNVPVPGVTISRPLGAPTTARVLTVPSLNLDAAAIGSEGAQLCIRLPTTGNCSNLYTVMTGGSAWSAALLSSDSKCCPVSHGRPTPKPPTGSCQSCFVWDVLGPDGTSTSATYNYFSRNSCELATLDPAEYNYTNCCGLKSSYFNSMFDFYRDKGIVLSGFDRVVCDRTSMRLCGTLVSQAAGTAMVKEWQDEFYLEAETESPYDITDDMCPMALINSTVRFYSAVPGSAALDTRCTPFNYSRPDRCWSPNKTEVAEYVPGNIPFPHSDCDSTPGITPFTINPYMDVRYGNSTDLYCINLGTAKPSNATSLCGRTSVIDRMSFWLAEPDPEQDGAYVREYLGVYLLTQQQPGGQYTSKPLNFTWGPKGDNAMIVSSLSLNVTTVSATKPKVCFERPKHWHLGIDSMDGLNFLWSAMFDRSGRCCPTYYSNTY